MFRSSKLGRHSGSNHRLARRPRAIRLAVESVEGRLLMASLASIDWTSGGVNHSEVFAMNVDGSVWADKDNSGFVSIGGYVQSITAGLDSSGNPEVYGIGGDNNVWVNHLNGGSWSSIGGPMLQIAAGKNNQLFGVFTNNSVWVSNGSSWTALGGVVKQISVGTDWSGNTEIYAIGTDSNVYVNHDNANGWTNLGGGPVTQIAATANNTVYALSTNGSVSFDFGWGWFGLGGGVKQISAGTDSSGNSEVYAIGTDNRFDVNDSTTDSWVCHSGYYMEVAASLDNTAAARGQDVSYIYGETSLGLGQFGLLSLAEPGASSAYTTFNAPLYNGGSPSYLDVAQGAYLGDCWLMASEAEVAARDPQDIKNMITYDGYGFAANGAIVPYYSVRFYSPNGSAFSVETDAEFPSAQNDDDQITNFLGTSALWAALVEKAYAEANAFGYVGSTDPDNGTYNSLNNGYASDALHAITGQASNWDGNPADAAAAWNAGDLVVLSTSSTQPPSSYIVKDHAYAMVGYNSSSSQPYLVYNPWGMESSGYAPPNQFGTIYGRFTANQAFINQNFVGIYTGSGAAELGNTGGPVEEITDTCRKSGGEGEQELSISVSTPGHAKVLESPGEGLDQIYQAETTDSSESFDLSGKKTVTLGASKPLKKIIVAAFTPNMLLPKKM